MFYIVYTYFYVLQFYTNNNNNNIQPIHDHHRNIWVWYRINIHNLIKKKSIHHMMSQSSAEGSRTKRLRVGQGILLSIGESWDDYQVYSNHATTNSSRRKIQFKKYIPF